MFICLVTFVHAVVHNSITVVILCATLPLNSILSLVFSFLLKSPGCNRVVSAPVIAIACPRVSGINWRLTSLSFKSNSILGNRGFHLRHDDCECNILIRVSELFLPGLIFNQVGINLGYSVSCINVSWVGKSSKQPFMLRGFHLTGEGLAFGLKGTLINVHQELIVVIGSRDLEFNIDALHLYLRDPLNHIVVATCQGDIFHESDFTEYLDMNVGTHSAEDGCQDSGTIISCLPSSGIEIIVRINMIIDGSPAPFSQMSEAVMSKNCAPPEVQKERLSFVIEGATNSCGNFATVSRHVLDFVRSHVGKGLVPPGHVGVVQKNVKSNLVPIFEQIGMVAENVVSCRIR